MVGGERGGHDHSGIPPRVETSSLILAWVWDFVYIWNGGLGSFFEASGMPLPMKPVSLEECLRAGGLSSHIALAQVA